MCGRVCGLGRRALTLDCDCAGWGEVNRNYLTGEHAGAYTSTKNCKSVKLLNGLVYALMDDGHVLTLDPQDMTLSMPAPARRWMGPPWLPRGDGTHSRRGRGGC